VTLIAIISIWKC